MKTNPSGALKNVLTKWDCSSLAEIIKCRLRRSVKQFLLQNNFERFQS